MSGSLQFFKVIRERLLKKITFGQRLEEVSKVAGQGTSVWAGSSGKYKRPQTRVCQVFSRNREKASVAGEE